MNCFKAAKRCQEWERRRQDVRKFSCALSLSLPFLASHILEQLGEKMCISATAQIQSLPFDVPLLSNAAFLLNRKSDQNLDFGIATKCIYIYSTVYTYNLSSAGYNKYSVL